MTTRDSFSVIFWDASKENEDLVSWYGEEGAQVPRIGDSVWIQTDKTPHSKWRVKDVQWSIRSYQLGISRSRIMNAEVWVERT